MNKFIAILLILGTMVACSPDTDTKAKKPKGKKTQVKKKASKNNAHSGKKAPKQSDYWPKLKAHLGVDQKKIDQLKNINAAYEKSKKNLKKDAKGNILASELNSWKTKKSNAMKSTLGPALFAKKVAFDKKRASAAAAKKKKANTKKK